MNGSGASISNDGSLVGGDGGTGSVIGSANRGGAGINATSSGSTNFSIANTGSITGGNGTNTGASTGGAGINAVEGLTVTNNGSITGGTGSGTGAGGAGIVGGAGSTIANASGGSINGGNGTFSAVGGAGITGAGLVVTNSGGIVGGLAGDGTTRANAITFTGGTNSLEIQAGSNIVGNAVAFSEADAFILGGSANASFNLAQIGTAAQYRGFGLYQKTGASIWTLTGSTTMPTSWTISAGTLQLGDGTTSGSFVGDVTNNGTFAFNRSDAMTFSGAISGTGNLAQIGSGITTLSGNSAAFSGSTNVSGGALLVNGSLGNAASTLNVSNGARLGGGGTVGGNVAIADGILAPGTDVPGTLTINGDLALAAASTLDYRLGADALGNPRDDHTAVGGNLILDGTLNVTEPAGGSFGAGLYRLISYGGTLSDNGLLFGTMPAGSVNTLQTSVAGQVNLVNSAGVTVGFWDGNGPRNSGTIEGGDGVWQAAGNDNWTDINGNANAPYPGNLFAIFSAAPGTVTVDDSLGAVSTTGMQFAVDGYVLQGDTITLSPGLNDLVVGDGTSQGAGYRATIDAALVGTGGLDKTDLGTLVLTGTNTYSGGTTISGGGCNWVLAAPVAPWLGMCSIMAR